MISAEELAIRNADIEAIEDDSIQWNGVTYAVTRSSLTKGDSAEIGGFVRKYESRVIIRLELFSGGESPNVEDTVIISGKTLKILEVEDSADGATRTLTLVAPDGS